MNKHILTFCLLCFIFCLSPNHNSLAQQIIVYPNNSYAYYYPNVYGYVYAYPVYGYQAVGPTIVMQRTGGWPFYNNRNYYQPEYNRYYMNYSHYYSYPVVNPYPNYEYNIWGPYRY